MDTQDQSSTTYLAYMLRLWQAGTQRGKPVWRASLENLHTGERLAFRDMQALFVFLADLLATLAEARATLEESESVDSTDSHAAGADSARFCPSPSDR